MRGVAVDFLCCLCCVLGAVAEDGRAGSSVL